MKMFGLGNIISIYPEQDAMQDFLGNIQTILDDSPRVKRCRACGEIVDDGTQTFDCWCDLEEEK